MAPRLPIFEQVATRVRRPIRRRSDICNRVQIIGGTDWTVESNPRGEVICYRGGKVDQAWLVDEKRRGPNWLYLPFSRIAWGVFGSIAPVQTCTPSEEQLASFTLGCHEKTRNFWIIRLPAALEPRDLPKEFSPLYSLRHSSHLPTAYERFFESDPTMWASRIRPRCLSTTGCWFTNKCPPKAIHDSDFIRAMRIQGLPGDEIQSVSLPENL